MSALLYGDIGGSSDFARACARNLAALSRLTFERPERFASPGSGERRLLTGFRGLGKVKGRKFLETVERVVFLTNVQRTPEEERELRLLSNALYQDAGVRPNLPQGMESERLSARVIECEILRAVEFLGFAWSRGPGYVKDSPKFIEQMHERTHRHISYFVERGTGCGTWLEVTYNILFRCDDVDYLVTPFVPILFSNILIERIGVGVGDSVTLYQGAVMLTRWIQAFQDAVDRSILGPLEML